MSSESDRPRGRQPAHSAGTRDERLAPKNMPNRSILDAVSFAAERFLLAPKDDPGITEGFERLGHATGAHRVFLYEIRQMPSGHIRGVPRHGWSDPDFPFPHQMEGTPDISPTGGIVRSLSGLREGLVYQFPRDEQSEELVALLREHKVRSLLIVPILLDGEIWGVLGLVDGEKARTWSDEKVETLRVAGIILGALVRRDRTEMALRESEAKYRGLVEGSKQPIVIIDRNGVFHFASARAAMDFGIPSSEIAGRTMHELFPSDYADSQMKLLRQAVDSRELFVVERPSIVGGRRHWYEVRMQPIAGPDGELDRVILVANDITERKEGEERILSYQSRLRSLTSELALAEQRERRRIAGEIHDRVGQALAISKIKLGILGQTAAAIPRHPQIAERIEEVAGLIDRVIQDTRSLTFELSPPVLYELGFEPAVEWLLERFNGQNGIPARYRDDGREKPIGDDMRIVLFQAVQEILLNIVKHAQAREVEVSVRRADETEAVIVEIHDDGVGFDPATHSHPHDRPGSCPGGFGLFSIRERLGHLGGSVEIDSTPGIGTRIVLRAPLRTGGAAAEERNRTTGAPPTDGNPLAEDTPPTEGGGSI
jgi:PAS domain S-box-containing protein